MVRVSVLWYLVSRIGRRFERWTLHLVMGFFPFFFPVLVCQRWIIEYEFSKKKKMSVSGECWYGACDSEP